MPARQPVIVIGAGPIGLAAAARLHQEGMPFLLFEAGGEVGAAISSWGHVRLFSPWEYLIDEAARQLLEEAGWQAPAADTLPTGHEFVRRYLRPLAAHRFISPHIETGTRVVSVSREGADKLKSPGRSRRSFEVLVRDRTGRERVVLGSAVIDASGSYRSPNPLGSSFFAYASALPAIVTPLPAVVRNV